MTLSERKAITEAYSTICEGVGTNALIGAGIGAVGGAIKGAVDHYSDKNDGKDSSLLKSIGKNAVVGAGIGAVGGAGIGLLGSAVSKGTDIDVKNPIIHTVKPSDGIPHVKLDDMMQSKSSLNLTSNSDFNTNKFKSTSEYLHHYYGDDAAKIEKNAITNRFGGVEQPSDRRAYNTSTSVHGNTAEYKPGRPDPMKHIHSTNGRSHASWSGNRNDVYLSTTSNWSKEGLAGHEIGHILNTQHLEHPSYKRNADDAERIGIGYHTGNDNEFGSFLGSVRRMVYKNTNGKVDTANPSDFRKVQSNPSKYGVSDYDKNGFKYLNDLLNYKGNNSEIIQRRDELKRRISDPKYMGQFVKTVNPKNKNVV